MVHYRNLVMASQAHTRAIYFKSIIPQLSYKKKECKIDLVFFSVSALEQVISPRIPGSFYWRTVFRYQQLDNGQKQIFHRIKNNCLERLTNMCSSIYFHKHKHNNVRTYLISLFPKKKNQLLLIFSIILSFLQQFSSHSMFL